MRPANDKEKRHHRTAQGRLRRMRYERIVTGFDKRPAIMLGLALAVGMAAVYSLSPLHSDLQEGVIAPRNVYSPRDDTWQDEEATEEAREQAAQGVTKIYVGQRSEAYQEMSKRLSGIMAAAEMTAEDLRLSREERVSDRTTEDESAEDDGEGPTDPIIQAGWDTLDPIARPPLDAFGFVVGMATEDRAAFREACQRALSRVNEEREVRDDEMDAARVHARERIGYWADVRALGIPNVAGVRNALVQVCEACIVPNSIYDHVATQAERDRVSAEVKPIMKSVKRGELIVAQGTVVDAEDIRQLRALGMVASERTDWVARLLDFGMAIFALILTLLLIHHFEPESLAKTRRLAALALLIAVPTIAFNVLLNQDNLPYAGYALTQFAVLAATLLLGHFSAACLQGILLVCFMLVSGPHSLHGMWAVLAGGVAGMLAKRYLTYRLTQVTLIGLASSVFAFVAIGFVDLYLERRAGLSGETFSAADLAARARWALLAGLTGIFCGHLAARMLEYSLETVTDMRLLELSDPSHPLLESLLAKAPGTYHGSLIVSSIAGNAAKDIGRKYEALLVRVGALYHDIGKMHRPHLFVENQAGRANPHDTMSPTLSARSIIEHVQAGVDLAEEHRLPRPIVDCIREHHGTTLVAYFYHRAQELGHDRDDESGFRYPGPKPRSVATGILMLADAVEAAVRSLQDTTRNAIVSQIHRIIEGKIADGQLDECPMTMREIKAVEASLTKSLLGIYHSRIEYPDANEPTNARTPRPRAEAASDEGTAPSP